MDVASLPGYRLTRSACAARTVAAGPGTRSECGGVTGCRYVGATRSDPVHSFHSSIPLNHQLAVVHSGHAPSDSTGSARRGASHCGRRDSLYQSRQTASHAHVAASAVFTVIPRLEPQPGFTS